MSSLLPAPPPSLGVEVQGGEEQGGVRTFRTGPRREGDQPELLEGHWRFRNKGKNRIGGGHREGTAYLGAPGQSQVEGGVIEGPKRQEAGSCLWGDGGECLSDLLVDLLPGGKFLAA